MQSLAATAESTATASANSAHSDSPVQESTDELLKVVVDPAGRLGTSYVGRHSASAGPACAAPALLISHTNRRASDCERFLSVDDFTASPESLAQPVDCLVLFLPTSASTSSRRLIDACVSLLEKNGHQCRVCVVTSFRSHLTDNALQELEESLQTLLAPVSESVVLLRPGHIISPADRFPASFARLASLYPLIPRQAGSVFLERDQLFEVIDSVTDGSHADCGDGEHRRPVSNREFTVLGRHRLWKDVLAGFADRGSLSKTGVLFAWLVSFLQIHHLAGLLLSAAARSYPPAKRWRLDTLEPQSVSELLSLYNPLNRQYVALAGHNTGVTHFGWKYPGRTVVRTTSCGWLIRVVNNRVHVDAGVLLRDVISELNDRGKELYVVPNYSYISLGTTFMVPVHGSGSEVSTLGDTIEQALIYDPAADRIRLVKRGDELFGRYMYSPASGVLVLRLRLRVRDRSGYFVERSHLDAPDASAIWKTFADPEASNIELRKSKADDSVVEVSRYLTTPSDDQETMEIPRDSIGRLWDRLEENPVTSWAFHTFVRKCGFHVELFLNEPEFEIFWNAHGSLPLSKIQLRLVKSDGLANSPFGDGDRISADIFMKRKDRDRFLSFMKEHLPDARFNPGKHSM